MALPLQQLLEILYDSGFEFIVIGLQRPKDKIVEAELRAIRDVRESRRK